MIEFFDITKSTIVLVDESSITKEEFSSLDLDGKPITRYILRAVDDEGNSLHKLCSKEEFDKLPKT